MQSLTQSFLSAGGRQSFPGAADLRVSRSARSLSGDRRPGPVSGRSREWTLVSPSRFRHSVGSQSACSCSTLFPQVWLKLHVDLKSLAKWVSICQIKHRLVSE